MTQQTIQLHIRAYRSEDWGEVCAVHDAARPQEVEAVMPPGTFAPMVKAAVDEDFFESDIFVACEDHADGPLVGFVAVEGSFVSWLYVKPAYQGQGVGSALMAYVWPLIGEDGHLTVIAENTRAVGFYWSLGFTPAAVFPGDCEGYPCEVIRLCLPTSRHRERPAQPSESSLLLAGFSADNWGHAERDPDGVWRWVR